jgi:hypothetical protein
MARREARHQGESDAVAMADKRAAGGGRFAAVADAPFVDLGIEAPDVSADRDAP